MLVREFLACELPGRLQYLLGGRSRWHRQDDVERLARRTPRPVGTDLAPRVRSAWQVPIVQRPIVDEFGGRCFSVQDVAVVGFEVEFAVAIDVLKVCLHAVRVPAATRYLDQDFLGTAPGCAHARSPSLERAAPRRLAPEAAGIDASGSISRDSKWSSLRHRAPPRIWNSRPACPAPCRGSALTPAATSERCL